MKLNDFSKFQVPTYERAALGTWALMNQVLNRVISNQQPTNSSYRFPMAPAPKETQAKGEGRVGKKKSSASKGSGGSAYTTYMKTAITELKASSPNLTHKERFKLAAQNWKKHPTNPKREKA
ncbi:hypothetical protein O181_040735 [Austropuccinia psidii MF-1]|uniref:YABBY protein C-terminal domain-containing protein n=1 Tax=Austropuccinia psidii MF-1 TaxID=1389203 RepID=A0A9Q3DHC4_9BASI|nr:hypothetical protein [Austropuccinia psidii MF-1]